MIKQKKIETDIATKEQLVCFVNSMEPNVRYEMPDTFKYEAMEIEFDKTDNTYSWTKTRSYKKMGSVGYVFPMGKGNMTRDFKTIGGARRSLIKSCEWMYKN